jgi:hypothetical protein
LCTTYRYVVKIEKKRKQKTWQFGLGNPSKKNLGKGGSNPHKKGQSKYGQHQAKKDIGNTKKDIEKWWDFHKIPWHNTVDCPSRQSLVAEVKASKSYAGSDSDSDPERGRWIIDV